MVYGVGRVIELLEYMDGSQKWRHSTTRPFQGSRETIITIRILESIWCIKSTTNDICY